MVPVNFDFFPSNNSQSHTLRAKIEITYSSNIRVRVKRGWGDEENSAFILFVHRKQKPRTHVSSGRPSVDINGMYSIHEGLWLFFLRCTAAPREKNLMVRHDN